MEDNFFKFRHLHDKSKEEIEKLMHEAPEICPLLGFYKCASYYFDEGIVYLSNPAYNAYTIPEWFEDSKEFIYTKIDMDDDFRREDSCIDLEELLENGWTIDELEKLYGIKIS